MHQVVDQPRLYYDAGQPVINILINLLVDCTLNWDFCH